MNTTDPSQSVIWHSPNGSSVYDWDIVRILRNDCQEHCSATIHSNTSQGIWLAGTSLSCISSLGMSVFRHEQSEQLGLCVLHLDFIHPVSLLGGEGCDLLRLLQGSFGPFGPKVKKKSENGFPGPLGPGGRKSRKRVEKESKKSKTCQFWTLFRLFRHPGPRGPGNPFLDFFLDFGPEGPKRPL